MLLFAIQLMHILVWINAKKEGPFNQEKAFEVF